LSLLRRHWANLAMIVLAVAAIIAVVVTSSRVTTSEKEARESSVLSAFREADLSRIEVNAKGTRLVLERTPGEDGGEDSWLLKEPIQEEADAYAIDKLLGTLEFARFVRKIKPEEVDRAAFGLDAPERTFKIQMGEIRYELRIGKGAAQPAGAHYAEIVAEGAPGSGVLLIARDLVQELNVDLRDLRDRQIIPYFSSEASRIVLEGQGGKRALKPMKDGRWQFDGMHGGVRLSRALLDTMLVQFARLKADHFLTVAEAEAALSDERIKISIFPKDKGKPTGIVEVGGRCPKSDNDTVALRRAPDPVAACVPKSVLEPLALPAERLLDTTVSSARKDEIESLTLRVGEKSLVLHRKESGFRMEKPSKGDVALDTGNAFVATIAEATGTLVPDAELKALGLSPPAGELGLKVVVSEGQVANEKIEIGRPTRDGTLHVRRVQDGAVLALSQDTARAFVPSAVLLRSPTVLELLPAEIRSVEISGDVPKQKFLRHASGGFELVEPKGYGHDAALCVELLDLLQHLSAERWVADDDDGSFGFEKPLARVRVSVERDAGTSVKEVVVGSLVSGGAYAKLLGDPGVFVLSRRLVVALGHWLIDRGVFLLDADNTKKIRLERDGKEIVLSRQGEAFVADKPSALTETAVRRLLETLSSLRAEGAVHLGPPRPVEGLDKPLLTVTVEGNAAPKRFEIGAADTWQETAVHYARTKDVRATYAIAKSKVTELLGVF
jgi:hypothetical protein